MAQLWTGAMEPQKATEFTQKICDAVNEEAAKRLGRKSTKFEAITVTTQVNEGTTYIIKTMVMNDPPDTVILTVHEDFNGNYVLKDVQGFFCGKGAKMKRSKSRRKAKSK